MATPSLRTFHPAQILTAVSNSQYILTESGCQFVIKSPLRTNDEEQRKAVRQLDTEMTILQGPLGNIEGVRRLVDQIDLADGIDGELKAGVLEYVEFDLHKYHLTQKRPFSAIQIRSIARQVLKTLANVHGRGIVHTDLKPENIVFSLPPDSPTSDIVVKIIDFGVASHQNEDRSRPITNPYWRSPECWLGMPWGPPADIWSFGAIMGSLLMEPGAMLFRPMGGLPNLHGEEWDREFVRSLWTVLPFPGPFVERAPEEWRDAISRFEPRLAPTGASTSFSFIREIFEISELDWAFVGDVLKVDPEDRLTADELLRHSWLS